MKNLVLAGKTAIGYWREHDLSETDPYPYTRFESLPISQLSTRLERTLRILGIHIPDACFLVEDDDKRRRAGGASFIIHAKMLPFGSLRAIDQGLLVVSPELCFVQYAKSQDTIETVRYGLELCGTYGLSGQFLETRYNRFQLTTSEKIERYIDQAKDVQGVKRARQACKHVVNGSASPLETASEMLLCLPRSLGGCGLPKPVLNHTIALPDDTASVAGKNSYRCDLFWPDHNLALEYNSTEFHASEQNLYEDSHRANILSSMGITVIQCTWDTLRNPERFMQTADILRKHMGLRNRTTISPVRFSISHDYLRSVVLEKEANRHAIRLEG